MAQPFEQAGSWWHEKADGGWLRWNEEAREWQDHPTPPPPSTVSAPAPPPPLSTPHIAHTLPLSLRAKWATGLLIAAAVLDAIALLSDFAERGMIERALGGAFVSGSEVEESDARQALIAVAQLLILIPTAIAFLYWFRRAYDNVIAFGARVPWKPGWAVGAWFVPILNLFRPKQIANAIWKASDPNFRSPVGDRWAETSTPAILNWWWGLWIATGVISWVSATMRTSVQTISDFEAASNATILADGLGVAVAVVAIFVVRDITERQRNRGVASHTPVVAPQATRTTAAPASNEPVFSIGDVVTLSKHARPGLTWINDDDLKVIALYGDGMSARHLRTGKPVSVNRREVQKRRPLAPPAPPGDSAAVHRVSSTHKESDSVPSAPAVDAQEGSISISQAIRELATMREEGLITAEEFEAKKREILERL